MSNTQQNMFTFIHNITELLKKNYAVYIYSIQGQERTSFNELLRKTSTYNHSMCVRFFACKRNYGKTFLWILLIFLQTEDGSWNDCFNHGIVNYDLDYFFVVEILWSRVFHHCLDFFALIGVCGLRVCFFLHMDLIPHRIIGGDAYKPTHYPLLPFIYNQCC